jgi:uncharacterized damage-inducible protein DinB
MNDDIPTLFAYHRWAEERMLAACRLLTAEQYAEPEPFEVGWPSIRSVVLHLAWANEIWLRRLSEEPPIPMFTDADMPELEQAATALLAAHHRFTAELLPSLTSDRLAAIFTYQNYKGVVTSAPLWTLLRHVVNHGTYHRGQIASKLKRKGIEPPSTDFSIWAVENTPQPAN